jgi:hypothetical protein
VKKFQLVGLTLSMSFAITGFLCFTVNVLTETTIRFNYYWIVGAVGIFLFVIFLLLLLLDIFKKRQPTSIVVNRSRSSTLRQMSISFTIICLGLGIGIFSTIFALYALSNSVNTKNEVSNSLAESQLRTAKALNIIAVILLGVQWLAIVLFVFSFEKTLIM